MRHCSPTTVHPSPSCQLAQYRRTENVIDLLKFTAATDTPLIFCTMSVAASCDNRAMIIFPRPFNFCCMTTSVVYDMRGGISKGECSTNVSCSDLSQRMSNECRWHNAQRLPAVRNDTNDTVSLPMTLFQLISLWYASFWFESGLVFMFD